MSCTADLCWVDCEMTGLNPFNDYLLEVAIVLTDKNLDTIDEMSWVVHQPLEILEAMDEWNRSQHQKSGLWNVVIESKKTIQEIDDEILKWISSYAPVRKLPLCGNSVHQDRFFIKKWLSQFDQYLHYRQIDVSTVKQLMPMWYPDFGAVSKSNSAHRACSDIRESIDELRYYRNYLRDLESKKDS